MPSQIQAVDWISIDGVKRSPSNLNFITVFVGGGERQALPLCSADNLCSPFSLPWLGLPDMAFAQPVFACQLFQ